MLIESEKLYFEFYYFASSFIIKKFYMEVKGTALKTTRDFVKVNFPNEYNKWMKELPEPTRHIFEDVLDISGWYPLRESYLVPINRVAKLFYNGDEKVCGDAIGYYSAEIALKGLYKVFLLIASPAYLIQRATKIITTFYRPSQVEAFSISSKSAGIRITEFSEMDLALEYRVGGWCKRALELSNCTGVTYEFKSSIAKGDSYTEIVFSWN
jgi:hypothetical protein